MADRAWPAAGIREECVCTGRRGVGDDTMLVIGISALYHDSAAALIADGRVLRAAQEERFSRVKHDRSFPVKALEYCIEDVAVSEAKKIDAVVYYDNPLMTCDRFIHNCLWIGDKDEELIRKDYARVFGQRMWVQKTTEGFFERKGIAVDKFLVSEHHMSHAAGAYFTSGYDDAAILVVDGVGEWKTTSLAVGEGNRITILKHLDYPHSLGLLYSAITYFCGFRVNSGEYKLMGLAAYGKPVYSERILRELINVKEDGSFRLNMEYFEFQNGFVMTGERLEEFFGCRRRLPESDFLEMYFDIAASIQDVTERIIVLMAKHLKAITNKDYLCMSGGCALNCVANGKLQREGLYDGIYIQPASGDAGGSIGAALYAYYSHYDHPYTPSKSNRTPYLGPSYGEEEASYQLWRFGAAFHAYDSMDELLEQTAELLRENKIVGFFEGRMEFGPRALGHRSILANPMSEDMQSKLNLKIKYRESFRPFAPAVLEERADEYFNLDTPSPYMLLTADVKEEHLKDTASETGDIFDRIRQVRSVIPAVTHVDNSARVQTVSVDDDAIFHDLIGKFYRKTGCPMLVNTSFNVRGEPIVCTVEDAYACFMNTEMDVLVLGNLLLYKSEQSNEDPNRWRKCYEAD